MDSRVSVIRDSPTGEFLAKWDVFLRHSAHASHYVTPDFLIDPFAGDSGERFAVLAFDDNAITGVLTGHNRNGSVESGFAVRPQIAFRDDADRAVVAASLAKGLATVAGRAGHISLFSWDPIDELKRLGYAHDLASGGDRVCVLDLGKGADMLFKEFSERRRTNLRKVMRMGGLEVKMLETDGELAELYQIYEDWNHRKGSVAAPFSSFQKSLRSRYRAVFIALHEGKVIAGTYLRFCRGGLVEYAANNSLDGFNKLRPNELLGWRAIEWACTKGFSRFSLGASHPFLARYGGDLVATHRYSLDRSFLKMHTQRERLSRLALRTYGSLPEGVRRRVKSAVNAAHPRFSTST